MITITTESALIDQPLESKVIHEWLKDNFGPSDIIELGSAMITREQQRTKERFWLRDYYESDVIVAIIELDKDPNQCIAYTVKKYNIY